MTSDGKEKIKAKFQELINLIKDEATTESQDFKQDVIKAVTEIKDNLEENWDKTIDIKDKTQENLNELMKDLEAKALKVQYTVQEKYSQGVDKKDEYVVKTADALVEAITKTKQALVKGK
ncbi:MAG: hypothetical protein RBT41_00385 [Clostridia bacterium]|jgi:sugar-specific transcriptional regulator TrmB|nr:hypothetical protein [Clostridia bacterium]